MKYYTQLKAPAFDIHWIYFPNNQDSKDGDHRLAIVSGGGGSAKTGVLNMIDIMKLGEDNVFASIGHIATGNSTCISVAFLEKYSKNNENTAIIAGGFDNGNCAIYSIKAKDAKISGVDTLKLCEFQADFSESDYKSVNCVEFFDQQHLITGGEDGVVRLWKLDTSNRKEYKVKEKLELVKSKGPIMSIHLHPSKPWVCCGAKDGSVYVINIDSIINKKNNSHKNNDNEKNKKDNQFVMCSHVSTANSTTCRGACFSNDGNHVISILCEKNKASNLIKWKLLEGSDSTYSLDPHK